MPGLSNTALVVLGQRALSPRDGLHRDCKRLRDKGAREQPPPKEPGYPCRVLEKEQISVSQSRERFALVGSGSRFPFPPVREMRHASVPWCPAIAVHLLGLLSKDAPSCQLAAMAFLVEVSPKASAAWLSSLPALCPLTAAAAWDSARALCCSLGPAPCGSGLPPAASPATGGLCLSDPGVPELE